MKRISSQIRDLETIENELNNSEFGVLAFRNNEEEIIQIATNFIYRDKNIYVFFGENDEMVEHILFDQMVRFTIIRNKSSKAKGKLDFKPAYKLFSITISGMIRDIDDHKLISELRSAYLKKYSLKSLQEDVDYSVIANPVLIDTEEIYAVEEIGG